MSKAYRSFTEEYRNNTYNY